MKILNKKAGFDYQLLESFEAGIHLFGAEVKAARAGNLSLIHISSLILKRNKLSSKAYQRHINDIIKHTNYA